MSFKNHGLIKLANMVDNSKRYFEWNMPDGNIKSKTCTGGIVTIIMVAILIAVSAQQYITLWERSDYRILEQSRLKVLTNDKFSFKKSDGFALAASFVGYQEEDLDIGELKFILRTWKSASEEVEFTELKQRECTAKDFETADDFG